MISKMSIRFMCGETYSKVPTVRCNDLWLVGLQQDMSGKRKETKKGKYNNVVCRSYGRSPMWHWADGAMGIGYSWWWSREYRGRSHLCGMLMSLLIRYAHMPFYFHFSFAFSTSLIHHYTPPLRRDHTRSRSLSHNNRTRSIGPISLIWWTYDLQFTCIYFHS